MNTDFRLSAGYFEHPKIQKLSRRLGDTGVLSHIRLLRFVAVNRPDGNLGDMQALDIALAGGFGGSEEEFLETLLEARLLDQDAGTLRIHDWVDHNDYAATAPQRKAKASAAASARWNKAEEPAKPKTPPTPAAPQHTEAPAHTAESPAQNTDATLPVEQCSEHDLALLNSEKTQMSNAPTSKPSYLPTSLPTSEANPTTTTSLPSLPPGEPKPPGDPDAEIVPAAKVVVASLRDLGVSESIAEVLVQRRGCQTVLRQIEWLPSRIKDREGTPKAVRDPAALLVKAIEDGYAVPASYAQARTRAAEEAERRCSAARREKDATERRAAGQQAEETGRATLTALWEKLPPDRQEAVTAEATARFRAQFAALAPKLEKAGGDPLAMPAGPRRHWQALWDAVILEQEHEPGSDFPQPDFPRGKSALNCTNFP